MRLTQPHNRRVLLPLSPNEAIYLGDRYRIDSLPTQHQYTHQNYVGEEGMVIAVDRDIRGNRMMRIRFDDGRLIDIRERHLEHI